jgi:hypothetical protein
VKILKSETANKWKYVQKPLPRPFQQAGTGPRPGAKRSGAVSLAFTMCWF